VFAALVRAQKTVKHSLCGAVGFQLLAQPQSVFGDYLRTITIASKDKRIAERARASNVDAAIWWTPTADVANLDHSIASS
jgi:hypothetical protein